MANDEGELREPTAQERLGGLAAELGFVGSEELTRLRGELIMATEENRADLAGKWHDVAGGIVEGSPDKSIRVQIAKEAAAAQLYMDMGADDYVPETLEWAIEMAESGGEPEVADRLRAVLESLPKDEK